MLQRKCTNTRFASCEICLWRLVCYWNPQQFDLIVSNPPYIDPEDEHTQALATEPRRALVADHHGLADIEIIIAQGKNWLKPQGWTGTWLRSGKLFEIFSQSMVLVR